MQQNKITAINNAKMTFWQHVVDRPRAPTLGCRDDLRPAEILSL